MKLNDTVIAALALRRKRAEANPNVFKMRDVLAVTGASRLFVINLERDGILPLVRRGLHGERLWSAGGFEAAVRLVRQHLDGQQA